MINTSVEILDLGLNNLSSLASGLKASDSKLEVRTISNANESEKPKLFILPGTGSFGAAMESLRKRGFEELLLERDPDAKIFGICLGMQLLGTKSEESPEAKGLDFIQGKSVKLKSTSDARVPNVGWTSVERTSQGAPSYIDPHGDFYFVHSYKFVPDDKEDALFSSTHGDTAFVSGIYSRNICGVQFHPEKSSRPGINLLTSILKWANE